MEIVLASASPRRRELLEQAGIRFRVQPARSFDESSWKGSPLEVARSLAGIKAGLVLQSIERERGAGGGEALVLGADTVVDVDGSVLGKPRDEADARAMLLRLAGRAHRVHTAVALIRPGKHARIESETSEVVFHPLTKEEIEDYLGTGDWEGKAGAYGIQSRGGRLVAAFRGCYYNVVGLPLVRTLRMLAREGAAFASAPPPSRQPACDCADRPLWRGERGCASNLAGDITGDITAEP